MKTPSMSRPSLIVLTLAAALAVLGLGSSCVSAVEDFPWHYLLVHSLPTGTALRTYLVGYGLGLLLGGHLARRHGPRFVLAVSVCGWSASIALLSTTYHYWFHLSAHLVVGGSFGAALPVTVSLLSRWVPERHRGLASGVVACGGRFAQASATGVTLFLVTVFTPLSTPATVTAEEIADDGDVLIHSCHAAASGEIESKGRSMVLQKIHARFAEPWPDSQDRAAAVNALIREPGALDEAARWASDLALDARAILNVPVSERTAAESERLNRLVIEATVDYPIPKLHAHGWRPAVQSYALLGVVVALAVWLVVPDRPVPHGPQVSPAAVPWRALLTSPNQWLSCGLHLFSTYGFVFLTVTTPWHLAKRFLAPLDECNRSLTVPLLMGAFAMLIGGVATDWLARSFGKRWGRALPMGGVKLSSAAFLAVCAFLPEVWMFVAAIALAAMCHDFGTPAAWAFAQDTGGEQAGVVFGWATLWGVVGAGIALALADGVIAKVGVQAAMLTGASALAVSAACGLMADATKPLKSEPEA